MTASLIEFSRNAKVATSYDPATGLHTLKVTAGTAVGGSFVELARNQKFATILNPDGIHTLQVLAGSSVAASSVELSRNPLVNTDKDTNGVNTLLVLDAGANVADSFIQLGRNPKIATDKDSNGRHTLMTIDAGAVVSDSYVRWDSNPKLAASFDVATGKYTLKTCTVSNADAAKGAYIAKAVNFDGGAILQRNALTGVVDSRLGIFSVWAKGADIFGSGFNGAFFETNNNFNVSIAPADTNKANFYVEDGHGKIFRNIMNSALPADRWFHILASWDTNHAAGQKIFQFYLTDVAFTDLTKTDASIAFDINWSDTIWTAGGGTNNYPDGPGMTADEADFYFAPGQYLDLSVEANRRKFISASGKPVDLGADGSTPTGVAPAIFFSGDASTFGQPNLGSGGAFTLTGSLTNASTSPSG